MILQFLDFLSSGPTGALERHIVVALRKAASDGQGSLRTREFLIRASAALKIGQVSEGFEGAPRRALRLQGTVVLVAFEIRSADGGKNSARLLVDGHVGAIQLPAGKSV